MLFFVKILIFSKIMVKNGGPVGTEISARWQKFQKKKVFLDTPKISCSYSF